MVFSYVAINESGIKLQGRLEAASQRDAEGILASKGHIPIKMTAVSSSTASSSFEMMFTKVKGEDLILFTRQFQVMVDAGVPILKIFSVLREQTENPKLKGVVEEIGKDLEEGSDLYDSFSRHQNIFSPLYCSLLKAGEKSGSLGQVLERLSYVIAHETEVKRNVKSALRYPVMVISFLAIAFVVLLTFVIPKFINIFTKSRIEIPWPTQVCITLSNLFVHYWPAVVGLIVLIVVGYRYAMKTEQGRMYRDTFYLNAPVFGNLVQKATMSRFTSIFAILQTSGVSVLSSLEILDGSLNNQAISKEFKIVRERLESGEGIAAPLRESSYFPPLVVNMIAIGEESGKLDKMLKEVSQHYDIEVEFAVKRLTDMLPTILTIGLAVVVGFFALAIYMPMWDLTKLAKR